MKQSNANKAVSVLLAVAMCPMMVPTAAFAAEDSTQPGASAVIEQQVDVQVDKAAEPVVDAVEEAGAVLLAPQAGDESATPVVQAAEDEPESNSSTVATVGETPYGSIEQAIAAWAKSGGTLTLLKDADDASTQTSSKYTIKTADATLDLAGHKLSLGKNYFDVSGAVCFTLKDTGTDGCLTTNNSSKLIGINNAKASFVMEGGALSRDASLSNQSLKLERSGASAKVIAGSIDTVFVTGGASLQFGDESSESTPSITNQLTIGGATSAINLVKGYVKSLDASSNKLAQVKEGVRFGGDYSSKLPASFKLELAPGSDGEYIVVALTSEDPDAAAQVTKEDGSIAVYLSAKDAVNYIKDNGGTMKLMKDESLSATSFTFTANATIDLNGRVLSSSFSTSGNSKAAFIIDDKSSLAIKDSSAAKSGALQGTGSVGQLILVKGHLSLEGGSIENNTSGFKAYLVYMNLAGASFNMSGGKLSSVSTSKYNTYISNGTFNVTGGSIKGGTYGLAASGTASVNLSSGEIGKMLVSGGKLTVGEVGGSTAAPVIDELKIQSSPTVVLNSGTIKTGSAVAGFLFSENSSFSESLLFGDKSFKEHFPGRRVLTEVSGGNYRVVDGNSDAAIEISPAEGDSVSYVTMAEALKNVKSGDTVKLLKNADISDIGYKVEGTSESKIDVTIDLNGCDLKAANNKTGRIYVHYATLTIKDSSESQAGRIYSESPYSNENNTGLIDVYGGKLVLESGNIDAASAYSNPKTDGQYAVGVYEWGDPGEVVVDGGTIKAGFFCIAGTGISDYNTGKWNTKIVINGGTLESTADYAIYNPQIGTVGINGGKVTGAVGGVCLNRGSLVVSGGTISSGGQSASSDSGDGTAGAPAAAISANAAYDSVDVAITGGTITAEGESSTIAAGTKNEASISVSGGSFNKAVDEAYCAEGFAPAENTNAEGNVTYGVEKKPVAEVNGMQYKELQAAVDAAQSGETVKLLENVDPDDTVAVSGKSITLDLNGKTIANTKDIWNLETDSWSLVSVREGGILTINGDGALKAKEDDCYSLDVQDGGSLVVNSGTYVGNIHAVYVERGKVVINGGSYSIQQTYYVDPSKPYEFVLNCFDKNRADGTASITVNGGTFDKFDPFNNCAEGAGNNFVSPGKGVNATTAADGTVSYEVADGVAQVVDASGKSVDVYEAIQAAIDAATDGQTVKLTGDVSLDEFVAVTDSSKTVTLDLNGKTASRGDGNAIVVNDGKLVIKDGTAEQPKVDKATVSGYSGGLLRNSSAQECISVLGGGELVLESGMIQNEAGTAIYVVGNQNPEGAANVSPVASTVTVKGGCVKSQEYGIGVAGRGAVLNVEGGVIEALDNAAVGGNGTNDGSRYDGGTTINISGGNLVGHIISSGYIACGVYHPQKGQLNITGGSIYADGGVGVLLRGGDVNITGGEITATGTNNGKIGDSNVISNCYGVYVDGSAGYYGAKQDGFGVSVSGNASVSADAGVPALIVSNKDDGTTKAAASVSAGTFSSAIDGEYCADGFTPAASKDADGNVTYGVAKGLTNFWGGSLRIDKYQNTDGTFNTDKADLRFGFNFDLPEGAERKAFGFKWGLAADSLTHEVEGKNTRDAVNERLDSDPAGITGTVTNLVITGIPSSYYANTLYAQLWVTYELGDVEYTITTDVQSRSINGIASAIVKNGSAGSNEYNYATALLKPWQEGLD